MTPAYLSEVAERDAEGTVAAIYDDIRAVLDVPVVNLIYRHLAVDAHRLESTWVAIRPTLAHAATRALAASLARAADEGHPQVARADRSAAHTRGVTDDDIDRARATLLVYDRANALNLLAARALVDGASGTPSADKTQEPARRVQSEILPMTNPTDVDDDVRATLHAMSEPLASRGEAVLVPSLYRHLASAPPLLRLVWDATAPALTGDAIVEAASRVRDQARGYVKLLPLRVSPTPDSSVRAVLEQFEPAMATMLVASRIVDAALPRD